MEADCDHSTMFKAPELYQQLVINNTGFHKQFKEGLNEGSQNHSTGILNWSPYIISTCQLELGDMNRDSRHRRKIESCRL
eukprot:16447938-Heterocapsa_arctica.AAC.2